MPREFDAAINRALDEYELLQRKADAFDKLEALLKFGDVAATSSNARYQVSGILVKVLGPNVLVNIPTVSPDTIKHHDNTKSSS